MTEACIVCSDDLRDAADLLLLNGHGFQSIARRLERPPEFADALRLHLYDKHVRGVTRENFTILIVDYLQDARKMLERELQKPYKYQRPSVISSMHKAIQWSITGYARMEGLYVTSDRKKISGDVIEALNQLADGNPEAVKRIAEARKKQAPVLIEAKPIDDGTSGRSA